MKAEELLDMVADGKSKPEEEREKTELILHDATQELLITKM